MNIMQQGIGVAEWDAGITSTLDEAQMVHDLLLSPVRHKAATHVVISLL
jgi:hypothetical protein